MQEQEPLTPIERKIFQFLVDHLKEETYQPSVREIGRKFGIRSTKTVAEHLESLARKGCITRVPARSRGVRLLGVNLSPQTYTIRAYNGSGPAASDSVPETAYELDRSLAGSPDAFLVQMDGAGGAASDCPALLAGDYLLVEPTDAPEAGDWVAMRRAEKVSVRRWGTGPGAGGGAGTDAALLGRVRCVVRRFIPQA